MNNIFSMIIAIILLIGLIAFNIVAIFIDNIDEYLRKLEETEDMNDD